MFNPDNILESFLQSSFDGILIFDQDYTLMHYNDAFKAIFELPEGDLVQANLFELLPFFKDEKEEFDRIFQGNSLTAHEFSYRHTQNHPKIVLEINASPILRQNTLCALLVIKNISEKKSKYQSLTNKRLKDAIKAYDFSSDRLKCIINSSNDLIVAIDPNFRFILFNDRFKASFEKYSGKKINLGVNILDCISHFPRAHKKAQNNWERALNGEEYLMIDKIIYEDGTISYFESAFNLVKDKSGQTLGASQIIRDITDRVQAEELWIASEKRFFKMFNEAVVGFALIDLENQRIIQSNPTLCEMLGFSQEDLARLSLQQLNHPLDFAEEQILIKKLLLGEIVSYKLDKRVYSKSHQEIWVSVSGTVLHDSDNQPEYLLHVIENITDQKLAQQKLTESEEQNRALVSAFPDMIFLVDRKGNFIDFKNKHNSFELPIVKLFGKNIQNLPLSAEIKQEMINLIKKAIHSNQVEFFECEIKVQEEVHQYEARFIKSGSDLVLLIVRDITKRKHEEEKIKELFEKERTLNYDLEKQNEMLARKEEELAQANTQLILQNESLSNTTHELRKSRENLKEALKTLEERNFELDQFVYKTSHDLRSPLSSVLGIVNLMKIDKDPERLIEYIDRIESSILRLDDFIQSMLNYSRNNRVEIKAEPIDYVELVNHSIDDLKYYKNFDSIRIDWEISGEHIDFHSDALRVKIIFNNIISNAIKYQDLQKKDRFIRIKITVTNEKTYLCFQDNGIGIEREYLKNIYKMFYRATEEAEGSGLGLYIVKQTVDKLKGHIHIDSEGIHKGLTVEVNLPNLKKLKKIPIT
ncbi:MAG: PAS domain S-box protein [Microscillaceae bacterium]|nr:PAS domain S-box protein [Microscillaceae bacterium]